jgi:hypothetical protein
MTAPKPGPPPRPSCPHPDKKVFMTQEDADKALLKILGSMVLHDHEGKMPQRTYSCRCGFFHHTSLAGSH